MRYHLTLVRMPIIKKPKNSKCWIGCGEKGMLLYNWWECKLIQPLWRTVWSFLKRLGIKLSYDPAISLLGIYPEKNTIQKDICTQVFIAALFTIAKTWKQPKCPLKDKCIRKICYIYTVEYYSVLKRNKTGSFTNMWMNLESVIQSEVRKRKIFILTHIYEI